MTFLEFIENDSRKGAVQVLQQQAAKHVYYHAQIHIAGVMPSYYDGRRLIRPIGSCRDITTICDQLIFADHPNEPPDARNERRRMLSPILLQAAQGQIQRFAAIIFQSGNYELLFENTETAVYFSQPNFNNKPFTQWAQNEILRLCITDPNGFILVYPNDAATLKAPKVKYLPTPNVLYSSPEVVIWIADDGIIKGADKTNFYSYSQADKEATVTPHYLGRLPLVKLGGITQIVTEHDHAVSIESGGTPQSIIYYTYENSFFTGFLTFADEVLRLSTQLQYVRKMHAFPIKQEIALDCETCNGSGVLSKDCACVSSDVGECSTCGGSQIVVDTCPTCNGQKTIVRSPSDVIRIPAPKGDLPDREMVRYYQPPLNSLDYLQRAFGESYQRALSAIYIQRSDIAQSGTAKREDRKDESTFLSNLSAQVFNVLGQVAAIAAAFIESKPDTRDGIAGIYPVFGGVAVTEPSNFDLRDTKDILDEFKDAMSTGDGFTIQSIRTELLNKINSGNRLAQKTDAVLNYCDKAGYRDKTIQAKNLSIASGLVTMEQANYYDALPNLCLRVLDKKGKSWFLSATIPDIEAELIAANKVNLVANGQAN